MSILRYLSATSLRYDVCRSLLAIIDRRMRIRSAPTGMPYMYRFIQHEQGLYLPVRYGTSCVYSVYLSYTGRGFTIPAPCTPVWLDHPSVPTYSIRRTDWGTAQPSLLDTSYIHVHIHCDIYTHPSLEDTGAYSVYLTGRGLMFHTFLFSVPR